VSGRHPTFVKMISVRDPAALREIVRQDPSALRLKNSLGETAFHYQVIEDRLDAVVALAELGADINEPDDFGETPLAHAVQLGYAEVVSWLISKKADLNAGRPPPLHYAAETGALGLARQLLDAGARTDVHNDMGYPVLHVAVEHDSIELVQLLIERGADILARSEFGQSILHVAACYASEALCRFLIAAGAVAQVTYPDGETPFDVAVAFGRESVAELLLAATERERSPRR
jgi:ankyrin repeat protein